ncbi:MAG: hypothetical protein WDN28_29850 [Chthoniobacter sp.]
MNVLRHLDLPQAAALAAEHSTVAIYTSDGAPWQYAKSVAAVLNLGEKRVQIREPLGGGGEVVLGSQFLVPMYRIFLPLFLACMVTAKATDYYVDPTNGDEHANGLAAQADGTNGP